MGLAGCRASRRRVAGAADLGRELLALGQVGFGGAAAASADQAGSGDGRGKGGGQQGARSFMEGEGSGCRPEFYTSTLAPRDDRPQPCSTLVAPMPLPAPQAALTPAQTALAWTHTARFLTTASRLSELPQTELPEIAFVGRSNAGKSTAINLLAQQALWPLPRRRRGAPSTSTSSSSARGEGADALLADLPGYGYAAVERGAKLRWQQVMADYLELRRGLGHRADGRRAPGATDLDRQLLSFVASLSASDAARCGCSCC